MLEALTTQLEKFTELVLGYAVLLAGVSTLAMALVEAFKGLTKARNGFHRSSLGSWIARNRPPSTCTCALQDIKFSVDAMKEELGLTAPSALTQMPWWERTFGLSQHDAIYSLDHPNFVGKLQMRFEGALRMPDDLPHTFAFIAAGDPGAGKTYREQLAAREAGKSSYDETRAESCFVSLHSSIGNKLDALQITIEYTWGRLMRFLAIAVGAVIMASVLVAARSTMSSPLPTWAILPLALVGGALAPVSKNVVKAIRQLRSH